MRALFREKPVSTFSQRALRRRRNLREGQNPCRASVSSSPAEPARPADTPSLISSPTAIPILNVDLKPLDLPGVNTLIADLTDSGQTFNALTTHFGFDGFDDGHAAEPPDAVVHFAAIPRVLIEPDNETFRPTSSAPTTSSRRR